MQIISWNDYGESHYIGPMGAETDQPNSQAWVDGFDHTAWATMTKYYADAWRTGVWPTITKNKIYISTRPAPKNASPSQYDSVGIPSNWQWVSYPPVSLRNMLSYTLFFSKTDDNIYCVVFSTGSYTLHLSIGSSSSTFTITAGVNKVKLAMAVGSPTASLVDSSGTTVLSFSPSFGVVSNPPSYNFNYYIQASP